MSISQSLSQLNLCPPRDDALSPCELTLHLLYSVQRRSRSSLVAREIIGLDSVSPLTFSSCEPSPVPQDDDGQSLDMESLPILPTALSELLNMSMPPRRARGRNRSPGHIPRPRNPYMLFRSAFAAANIITTNTEHDNRHITRIISHCWSSLPEDQKQGWCDKAAAEKAEHARKYPNYRFTPAARTSKSVKRRVSRRGPLDLQRCERAAKLVLAGKRGSELEHAMKIVDTFHASSRGDSSAPQVDGNSTSRYHLYNPHQSDSHHQSYPFPNSLILPGKEEKVPSEQTSYYHNQQVSRSSRF